MTSQELSVTIDDEEYQLNITPTSKQRLVMQAREMLLEEIEMNTLASDLRLVGSFVRLSYNAVGAAGPKYTTVQIEIQTLGFDITKLCDTSALTLGLFRSSARTILDTLHSTYEFLLSGLEDVAADNFYSIKKLAQDMEKAARELHSKFDSQVSKTEDVLKNVQKAKGEAALESERMQKEREKTEQERKIADDLRMKAAKKEQEAEAQVKEEELKVEQASENIGYDVAAKLINGFVSMVTSGTVTKLFDTKEDIIATHEKCKKEHQDAAEKCKKERVEMMEKLVKFANSLSSLSTEKEFSDKAVTSLHEAISALKHLAAIMLHAANFWIILEKHCETLHNYGLGDLMQKYMAKDESVRKRLWISAPFKKQAVQFCCRWVVLYDVCTDYLEPLKETRAELYKYITENPTWEQSKQNVQELAKVFAETVNKVKQLDAKPLESQPETENAV
eukprot:Em0218g4a